MARRRVGGMRRVAHIGALGLLAALLSAAAATATGTPAAPGSSKTGAPAKAGPVTDANVAARVLAAHTRADHAALGAYYKAKAAAETRASHTSTSSSAPI